MKTIFANDVMIWWKEENETVEKLHQWNTDWNTDQMAN
jgi:hypothetical protein